MKATDPERSADPWQFPELPEGYEMISELPLDWSVEAEAIEQKILKAVSHA